MGKLGAGFNLPDSPNRCKSQHNCGNMWGSCSAYTRKYWLWRRLAAARLPSQMFCLVKQRVVACIPSGLAHWAVQQAALRWIFFPPSYCSDIAATHCMLCFCARQIKKWWILPFVNVPLLLQYSQPNTSVLFSFPFYSCAVWTSHLHEIPPQAHRQLTAACRAGWDLPILPPGLAELPQGE